MIALTLIFYTVYVHSYLSTNLCKSEYIQYNFDIKTKQQIIVKECRSGNYRDEERQIKNILVEQELLTLPEPMSSQCCSYCFCVVLCQPLFVVLSFLLFLDISLYVIIQFTADDYPMWILQILLIAYSTYYIRKRRYQTECVQRVSIITIISYAQSHNIWIPNSIKVFGNMDSKGPKQDGQNQLRSPMFLRFFN